MSGCRGGCWACSHIVSSVINSLDEDPDAFFIREIQWKRAGLSKSQVNVPVVEKGPLLGRPGETWPTPLRLLESTRMAHV